ncbi:tyrosine-type recombinase/integrase [Paenibacillus chondroitinus]|uniref:Tyrosine-type recombinase/integrase n=1 Tax=Paenibacillus chondroitinus TaxID=59842 RepID=A0ABU6DL14_9BACL|nr:MULTISPECIES: tyrosine-type recombinase/integrase [Paenibacillus]MCY9657180.1 tyrosine-type recombinase/integrase [Paenibacillus anseongense]MEB4798463.1 tyrosine-type recombinase/integrase [Paenibacillus chondroitinus]
MDWITWEEFRGSMLNLHNTTNTTRSISRFVEKEKIFMNLYEWFMDTYPSYLDWLKTPVSVRKKYVNESIPCAELYFILTWAIKKEIFNSVYKEHVLEYLMTDQHKSMKNWIRIAQVFGYCNEIEFEYINQTGLGLISRLKKYLSIHCMVLNKPFKSFTDNDVEAVPRLFVGTKYTAKAIQDLRIKLGYTNKTMKVNQIKRRNWTTLFNEKQWGPMFDLFQQYLISSDAKPKYIAMMGVVITKLLCYLEQHGLSQCSDFKYEDFVRFTDWLLKEMSPASAMLYISKIKVFFQWGVNESSFFPNKIDFPDDYWSRLYKIVKDDRIKSDGLAFKEEGIADQIVKALTNYNPQNEHEELCRWFWLIIASCPARFSFILNLESQYAIQPLPNEPSAYGVYSQDADKAGNKYGQFPILDQIGIQALYALQNRIKRKNFKAIYNESNKRTYIHLFQLDKAPWLLSEETVRSFFNEIIKPQLANLELEFKNLSGAAHSFRHHLLTQIALISGDVEVVMTAAGHQDEKMTREYLKSKVSRTALLFKVMNKYESGEITGKFYFRLLELLTSEESPVDAMLRALTTEMNLEQFLGTYGKKMDMGYCLGPSSCNNWLKCWGCHHFLMTREEIVSAIKTLAHQIINMREMIKNSRDFTYNNSIAAGQMKGITLIVKRLGDLKISQDQITSMVNQYLSGQDIKVVAN